LYLFIWIPFAILSRTARSDEIELASDIMAARVNPLVTGRGINPARVAPLAGVAALFFRHGDAITMATSARYKPYKSDFGKSPEAEFSTPFSQLFHRSMQIKNRFISGLAVAQVSCANSAS
jgi:hypothetical protein